MSNEKKKDFNETHPELKPGEKFLCNAGNQGIISLHKRWKTLRLGQQAFSTDGKEVQNCVPVFVNVSEKISFRAPI